MKKYLAYLIMLLIVGASVANLSNVVAIASGASKENGLIAINVESEKQSRGSTEQALDFQSLKEIIAYLRSEAASNNFEIITIGISSAVLFESEETLIIIGHGYFDANGSYFIGNYYEGWIQKRAQEKRAVALLGCYSAHVNLSHAAQLTFAAEIDLFSALAALRSLLGWRTQNNSLLPTRNIQLFELDPGGPGNGWTIDNPPPLFNLMQIARGEHYEWDLQSENGIQHFSEFLLNNKMTGIRLYFSGEFLVVNDQNTYYTTTQTVQFDSWIYKDGAWDYLHIQNIITDGISIKGEGNIKVFDLLHELMSTLDFTYEEAMDNFARNFLAVAAICGGYAIGAFAIVASCSAVTGAFLAFIGFSGALAFIVGVVCLIIGVVYAIKAWVTFKRNS